MNSRCHLDKYETLISEEEHNDLLEVETISAGGKVRCN